MIFIFIGLVLIAALFRAIHLIVSAQVERHVGTPEYEPVEDGAEAGTGGAGEPLLS